MFCATPPRDTQSTRLYVRLFRGLPTLLTLLALLTAAPAKAQEPPNVLWIVMDACRADALSCYGYTRDTTPVLDALAARGAVFENNFAQAGHTVRSTPTYITGRHFPVHSLVIRTINWQELGRVRPPCEKLAPTIFREAGYHTGVVSTSPWIVPGAELYEAFDDAVYDQGKGTYAEFDTLAPHIVRMIDAAGSRPFFIHVHALDTHTPHLRRTERPAWFPEQNPDAQPKPPFDDKKKAWLRAEYDTSTRYMDEAIGRLFDQLTRRGIMENTVVVFSSDHGELLGEDGHSLLHPADGYSDEQLHTPLILAGPGIPVGKRCTAFTENTDILPTLCSLAGIKVDVCFDGLDLTPLMHGQTDALERDYVFSRIGTSHPWFVLTNENYKGFDGARNGTVRVIKRPDSLGKRTYADAPEVAQDMNQALQAGAVPRFTAYANLPFEVPPEFYIRLTEAHAPDHGTLSIGKNLPDDGKWGVVGQMFEAHPTSEQVPPLVLSFPVPDARWEVEALIRCNGEQDQDTQLLSSRFVVSIEGNNPASLPDAEEVEQVSNRSDTFYWTDLGTHEVHDGNFDMVLEPHGPAHFAAIRWLRFKQHEPRADDADNLQDAEEPEENTERLKALGYL